MQISAHLRKKNKAKISLRSFSVITLHLLITVMFLSILFSINSPYCTNSIIVSGVSSTLEETTEIIKGIGGFLKSFATMISVISGFIGIRAIVLFIIVSLFGLGLSFIGIPRGKASFFASLIIIDIVWFLWLKNMSSGSFEIMHQIWKIIKTSLILIIPFIVIHLFKSKSAIGRFAIKFIYIFRRNKNNLNQNTAVKLAEDFQDRSSSLQKSLFNDILTHNNKGNITLSPSTLKERKKLEDLLKEIK
ncbi:MAG: hypothetical protein JW864_16900 [Spirochaetes bacterium]|nr:hypothetical protein [Spirochaetota bacterium]